MHKPVSLLHSIYLSEGIITLTTDQTKKNKQTLLPTTIDMVSPVPPSKPNPDPSSPTQPTMTTGSSNSTNDAAGSTSRSAAA